MSHGDPLSPLIHEIEKSAKVLEITSKTLIATDVITTGIDEGVKNGKKAGAIAAVKEFNKDAAVVEVGVIVGTLTLDPMLGILASGGLDLGFEAFYFLTKNTK